MKHYDYARVQKTVFVHLLIREDIAQRDENTKVRFPFVHFYANQSMHGSMLCMIHTFLTFFSCL